MAAYLDYIAAEVLELAGNAAQEFEVGRLVRSSKRQRLRSYLLALMLNLMTHT